MRRLRGRDRRGAERLTRPYLELMESAVVAGAAAAMLFFLWRRLPAVLRRLGGPLARPDQA